ncbi:LamG-like jellyroll fold domain-containing protein [Microbacterium sp.]|uniref:LamG-like jellyroll fold domain-containing protein n=1 Tax=Microbacterium sp. TaxID=51671 RepID=UPI0039E36A8D
MSTLYVVVSSTPTPVACAEARTLLLTALRLWFIVRRSYGTKASRTTPNYRCRPLRDVGLERSRSSTVPIDDARILRRGFTVVELLIVIVVIAILATITAVSYRGITARATETAIKSDLQTLATQLELDAAENGEYPASASVANGGKGLVVGGGRTFTYSLVGEGYCLSVTAGSVTYYYSSSVRQITSTSCGGTDPAPIAEWKFNEGSGTTAGDSSGNGYTLTASGSGLWTASGHSGAGMSNACTGYFYRNGLGAENLSTWTVAFWYKRTGTSTSYANIIWDTNQYWIEVNSSGNLGFGSGEYSYPIAMPLNAWHFIALVADSASSKLTYYYDGNVVKTDTITINAALKRSNTWWFGKGEDDCMRGYLDDVRIYSSALTQEQVQSVMSK